MFLPNSVFCTRGVANAWGTSLGDKSGDKSPATDLGAGTALTRPKDLKKTHRGPFNLNVV